MDTKIIQGELREYRCETCKKLLFKGLLIEGSVEVKCKYCHEFTKANASLASEFFCANIPCPHRAKFTFQEKK